MSMRQLHDLSRVYLEQVATEAFVDPEQGEAPSGRSPLQNVSDHPKASVRKKAVGAFKKQMGKEYGGTWKSRSKDPVAEAVKGQDTEMRKAASAERRAGDTLSKKLPSYKGKEFAKFKGDQISYADKKSKGKHIPGYTYGEEAKPDYLDFDKDGNKKESMKKALKDKKKVEEALDPVGQEDSDIDNDGKSNTKSDKYLMNRRKVRGAAIKNEGFSDWRQDLSEVIDSLDDRKNEQQIKEKKVQNKIEINPKLSEAIEEIGGTLIEMVEVEEGYKPIDREKESAMYRRAGNLARTAVSSRGKKKAEAQEKSSKIVSAITRQKEKERFDRIGQSPAHNEEFELDEKTLTPGETKKKEKIVKSMKKSAGDFEKRYPGRGKEVMYATATKMAKKVAEATDTQAIAAKPTAQQQKKDLTQDPLRQKQLQTMKMMQQKELQLQRQKFALQKQGQLPITREETEVLDERRRSEKGTPRGPEPSAAFKAISKMMGSGRVGVQPRGVKKDKGGPTPGPSITPAQKVAKRRAAAQKAKDLMHSPRD